MRKFWCFALLCLSALALPARADEEKIAQDKLPKAVAEAVKKRFPKADFVEAAKEVENGKTEYEVTVKENGKKIDVTLTEGGEITTIEKEIAEKDFPKAVTDALKAKYPGAKYEKCEEVIKVKDGKEKLEYYEALLTTADKKKVEVEIAANGEIKKTEDKTEKKD